MSGALGSMSHGVRVDPSMAATHLTSCGVRFADRSSEDHLGSGPSLGRARNRRGSRARKAWHLTRLSTASCVPALDVDESDTEEYRNPDVVLEEGRA